VIARREQFHQNVLGSEVASDDGNVQRWLQGVTSSFTSRGLGAGAEQHARAWLGALLTQQARLLAYLDAFMVIAACAILILPFGFFLLDHRRGLKGAPSGH